MEPIAYPRTRLETSKRMIRGSLARSFKLSGIGGKGEARFIASTALALTLESDESNTTA